MLDSNSSVVNDDNSAITIANLQNSDNQTVINSTIMIAELETTTKSRRKSGIDLAMEDVAAGRVFQAKDGADLIRQCLEE